MAGNTDKTGCHSRLYELLPGFSVFASRPRREGRTGDGWNSEYLDDLDLCVARGGWDCYATGVPGDQRPPRFDAVHAGLASEPVPVAGGTCRHWMAGKHSRVWTVL